MWSSQSLIVIRDLKKLLLKKKLMLNIIIESYSWYDKIFRYIHLFLATAAPLVVFIDKQITGTTNDTSTISLIISGIVAGMLKLKDYLTFDKINELAKQQTIKYEQLYQKIESELRKSDSVNEEEFIFWINREYSNIDLNDPELSFSLRKKYIELCKKYNIPYDEDLLALKKLLSEDTNSLFNRLHDQRIDNANERKIIDNINEQARTDNADEMERINGYNSNINDNAIMTRQNDNAIMTRQNENAIMTRQNENAIMTRQNDNAIMTRQNENAIMTRQNAIMTRQDDLNTINNQHSTAIPMERVHRSISIIRTESEEKDRREYKEKIKTLDTQQDLKWALDRLNMLEN